MANNYFMELKLFLINKEAAGDSITYSIKPDEVYFIFGNREFTFTANDEAEIKDILNKLKAL